MYSTEMESFFAGIEVAKKENMPNFVIIVFLSLISFYFRCLNEHQIHVIKFLYAESCHMKCMHLVDAMSLQMLAHL